MADRKRGVHERGASALAEASVQVAPERDKCVALQLDEAAVAGEFRERPRQMLLRVLCVKSLQVAVAGSMEQDEERHHFRGGAKAPGLLRRAPAPKQAAMPSRFKEQAEVVDVAENR